MTLTICISTIISRIVGHEVYCHELYVFLHGAGTGVERIFSELQFNLNWPAVFPFQLHSEIDNNFK